MRETIRAAVAQRYGNIEVIAVNDGSTDTTAQKLDALLMEYPELRVIPLEENQGKAVALKTVAAAAGSDLLICIDGNALLDRDAAAYMVAPLLAWDLFGTLRVKGALSLLDNDAQELTLERVLFYSAVAVRVNLLLIGRVKYNQIRFRVVQRIRRPGLTAQVVTHSLPVAQHHQQRLSTARCAAVRHCAGGHIQRVTVKHG